VKSYPNWAWVDFTGGEPTDREDFADIVGLFSRHCRQLLLLHFPTNGLRPDRVEDVCMDIRRRCPGSKLVISVSVDGPPALHDRLRGIPGGFDKAVETFSRIRIIPGIDVFLGMTLGSENVDMVKMTLDAVRECGIDVTYRDLHVNVPHKSEHYYGNIESGLAVPDEVVDIFRNVSREKDRSCGPFGLVERIYAAGVPEYLSTGRCPLDCAALKSSCFIDNNGDVYPCSIWGERIGSLRDVGFDLNALRKSGSWNELRQRVMDGDCRHCWTPCEAYQSIFGSMVKAVTARG